MPDAFAASELKVLVESSFYKLAQDDKSSLNYLSHEDLFFR